MKYARYTPKDEKPKVRVLAWYRTERHEYGSIGEFMAETGANRTQVEYMRNGRTWNGWNIIEVGE